MHVLVKGLPPDALVRVPVEERGREPWTAYHELIAQLVEVTSVGISGRQLRKPIQVPRPKKAKPVAAVRVVEDLELAPRPAPAAPAPARTPAPAGVNPYRSAMAALGGAQPSRLRAQLAGGEKAQETA